MRNVGGAANNYYTTDFYSSYTAKASIATSKTASNICIKTAWVDLWCTGIKNSGNNAWKAGFTYIVGTDGTNVATGLAISGVAACALAYRDPSWRLGVARRRRGRRQCWQRFAQ